MKNTLKNCPCCSGKPVLGQDTSSDYDQDWTWWIECKSCGLSLIRQYKDDVIKLWNMRKGEK